MFFGEQKKRKISCNEKKERKKMELFVDFVSFEKINIKTKYYFDGKMEKKKRMIHIFCITS